MKRAEKLKTKAVLTSNLSLEARVMWTYLRHIVPGGSGLATLEKQLGLTLARALSELRSLGLVEKTNNSKLKAVDPDVNTDITKRRTSRGDLLHEDKSLVAAARRLAALYSCRRDDAGHGSIRYTDKVVRHFVILQEWINENDVDFETFLSFAVDNCSHLERRGIYYPPVNLLCGNWLRELFTGRGKPSMKKSSTHAGKYHSSIPQQIRETLVAAGFERAQQFSKGELRHVVTYADSMRKTPSLFRTPDPDFEPEILWLLNEGPDAVST